MMNNSTTSSFPEADFLLRFDSFSFSFFFSFFSITVAVTIGYDLKRRKEEESKIVKG